MLEALGNRIPELHHLPSRVVFMDGGRIVEQGAPEQVINRPQEPRTKEFLARYKG